MIEYKLKNGNRITSSDSLEEWRVLDHVVEPENLNVKDYFVRIGGEDGITSEHPDFEEVYEREVTWLKLQGKLRD